MDCYSYKLWKTTSNPILKNLDVTVILMMEGHEDRFKKNDFILNLAKKTYIQYNKGYKKCNKDNINSSGHDLNFSNYIVMEKFNKYNNILILEEDAEIFDTDPKKWAEIDNFIGNVDYQFLSVGSLLHFHESEYENFNLGLPTTMYMTQAMFYNKTGREKLMPFLKNTNFNIGHWDSFYLSIANVYVYEYPLIVQLFPVTENSETYWPGGKLYNRFVNYPKKLLRLDKKTDGWNWFYTLNRHHKIILFLSIFIVVFSIYFFYYKK